MSTFESKEIVSSSGLDVAEVHHREECIDALLLRSSESVSQALGVSFDHICSEGHTLGFPFKRSFRAEFLISIDCRFPFNAGYTFCAPLGCSRRM